MDSTIRRNISSKINSLKPKVVPFVKKHKYPVVLFLITFFICLRNYKFGTFLTGWDTLHPEFNYGHYLKRIIFGAWQEHQGLGAVATQAHASELPRVLTLILFDIFLPLSAVRYSYMFFCIILGVLGMYYFLRDSILKTMHNQGREMGAFLGALFYILNLGLVQHTYVPLEMFVVHYGFMPWLFLVGTNYFYSGKAKNLWVFYVISFFAAPMAHTSTLWFVYAGALALYFGILWLSYIKSNHFKLYFRHTLIIGLSTIIVNSFWLFPNLYFAINHGKDVQNSKIHQLFSQEAFLQNKNFGNLADIAIIRGFLFNWGEHIGGGNFGPLLDEWQRHHANFGVLALGYFFFALVVVGILLAIATRNRLGFAVLAQFLFAFFFLVNTNGPLGDLFSVLQHRIPLFKEAFRFPFTKFSILLMFSYAVFFGFACSYVSMYVSRHKRILARVYTVLIAIALIYYTLPMFQGYLISPSMRVAIPKRYFDMFDYFDKQPQEGRVVNFPMHSFWGWVYYNWDTKAQNGYQGAGFLWFGIKQPLLDREFDRWDPHNEQYYREMSYAVYKKDTELFKYLLTKYNVKWLVFDESVFAPGLDQKVLNWESINELVQSAGNITLAKNLGGGLKVYKVQNTGSDTTDAPLTYKVSSPEFTREPVDYVYRYNKGEDYVTFEDLNKNTEFYPFRDFLKVNEAVKDDYIELGPDYYVFNSPLYSSFKALNVPNIQDTDSVLDAGLSIEPGASGFNLVFEPLLPSVGAAPKPKSFAYTLQNKLSASDFIGLSNDVFPLSLPQKQQITLRLDKDNTIELFKGSASNTFTLNPVNFEVDPESCSAEDDNQSYGITTQDNAMVLVARNIESCGTIPLKKILEVYNQSLNTTESDFVLQIAFNYAGKGLEEPLACLLDSKAGRCVNRKRHLFASDGTGYFYARMNKENMDNYYLRFLLDAKGSKETKQAIYSNITVRIYDKFGEELIPSAELYPNLKIESNTVKGSLKVYGLIGQEYHSEDIFEKTRKSVPCSYNVPKANERNVKEGYVEYISKNGFTCDHIQFEDFPHSRGYILQVESRNIEGLPLRLCVVNLVSNRCDYYTTLSDNDEFKKEYFIIYPGADNQYGYGVNIDNLSFGEVQSTNHLKSLRIIPAPINWIYSVSLGNHGGFKNPAEVLEKRTLMPDFYYMRVSKADHSKLITLNQSFEKGWVTFPRTEHIKVNNWANGWILRPEDTNILIFFWPQLTEFLGFILLVGFGVYLVVLSVKDVIKEAISSGQTPEKLDKKYLFSRTFWKK